MSKRLSKRKNNERKKLKISLSHPIFLLIFTILAIVSIISLRKTNEKASISRKNIENLEETVAELETAVEEGKEDLEDSQNEIYKEKIIRNELLQKKEGEIILQIPEVKEEEMEEVVEDQGQLEAWRKLIF